MYDLVLVQTGRITGPSLELGSAQGCGQLGHSWLCQKLQEHAMKSLTNSCV